jgi:hypothetical protein
MLYYTAVNCYTIQDINMTKKRKFLPLLIISLLVVVGLGAYVVYRAHTGEAPPFVPPEPPKPVVKPITYSSITLATDKPDKEVTDAVGFENLSTVLSLNRIDEKHFQKGQIIVYPNR